MGRGIRIDSIGGFSCTVEEFLRRYAGYEHAEDWPFPHASTLDTFCLSADDHLQYGSVLYLPKPRGVPMDADGDIVFRFVTLTLEGTNEQYRRVAIYGMRDGGQRKLADGAMSIRVRPFTDGDEYEADRLVRSFVQSDFPRLTALVPNGARRVDVVFLVEISPGDYEWQTADDWGEFIAE